jgi:dolichyl-phosphate beta-glucosyltransferase
MPDPNGIFLSVVIPAYNEEKRLAETLHKIQDHLKGQNYSWEIILVDDGSTDGTLRVAEESFKGVPNSKILTRANNLGKGCSVREGVLKARGQYILFSDADLSTPIEELDKCFSWIAEGYDIAIGSRGLRDSDVQIPQSLPRRTMGKIFNLIVQALVFKGIKDTQCGFKLFRREPALELFRHSRLRGFGFDVEILFSALQKRYKIKEIPVVWRNFPPSRVRLVSSSAKMLFEVLEIRLRNLF